MVYRYLHLKPVVYSKIVTQKIYTKRIHNKNHQTIVYCIIIHVLYIISMHISKLFPCIKKQSINYHQNLLFIG